MDAECSDLIARYKKACSRMLPFSSDKLTVGDLWAEVDARLKRLSRGPPDSWSDVQARDFRAVLRVVEECASKRSLYEETCLGGAVDASHRNYNFLAQKAIEKYRAKLDEYERTRFSPTRHWALLPAVGAATALALILWTP